MIVIFDTFALLLVSIVVSIYASVLYSYVRQTDRIHTQTHGKWCEGGREGGGGGAMRSAAAHC